ncbi:MAG: hypothetical protein WBA07_09050 [Rivularia sp. (in: cyanobacteria)]
MALILNHFDTKTKQNTGIKEKLENTLAEYLFDGAEFNIGTAYPEATVASDLTQHNGMTLQFCAGKRMFFANDSNLRSLLYPNPSDGAAYPLPFTSCQTFHELRNARILVIDDITGDSGGIIAPSNAKKLVGDCKGLIDSNFAKANSIEPSAFQFRLGIKPQEESPVMRIAKGTLAPANLDKLGESSLRISGNIKSRIRTKTGYDMVLATSSFKGRKGADAIKPGEYVLDVGLGVKSIAKYREHSLGTQILVNYPYAVKEEILPIIKQQAEKLALEQKNPKLLALRYVENYERRKNILAENIEASESYQNESLEEKFSIFDSLSFENENEEIHDSEELNNEQKDLLIYSLLKVDLSGYCQLIEHPKIISELQEFVRKEWVDIATGRSIKFTSGMAQPSLDLKLDEISIPYIQEGEEIIVTRSPLINSNGVITLKNKHLPKMLDGCVYIHPDTAMDNMQCDFDGDLLAFAPSTDFPLLASEAKQNNLPQNRYPNIVKKAKIPYQGTFEEIAVSAMESKIGFIANEIQKNVALQCEIDTMPQSEKIGYTHKILRHLNYISSATRYRKLQLPHNISNQINKIINNPQNKDLNNNQIEQKLQLFKQLLKNCVAELGNELQVAADGPKSALRPNQNIIQYCQAITAYKEVEWLADKKNPDAFTDRGMKTNGYSPIDLMIEQTNQIFEQCQLNALSIEQFRNFYPGIEFTTEQKKQAQEIKTNYNSLVKQWIQLEQRKKLEPGPYLVITSPTSGKKLEITNLINFEIAKNPNFWKFKQLTFEIASRKPTKKMPHPLFVRAKFTTSDGNNISIPVGTLSFRSIKEHQLKPGMLVEKGNVEFHFGVSDRMIDALKQQLKEYVESIGSNTPTGEKLQLAAAIHDVSHTEENYKYSGKRRASVAFAVFPSEVINQLKELQFTQMRIIGTQFNEYADRNFSGERVPIQFEDGSHPRDNTKTARWVRLEGKKFGTINAQSPALLAGCEAYATVTSAPTKSVIVTSLKNPDNKLQIDSVDKYETVNRQWRDVQTSITLEVHKIDSRKPPTVYAKVDNRILGIVNKKSVNFLQQKLAAIGRPIQGFTFSGTINNAPASYADIIVDPTTVKYSDIQTSKQQQAVVTSPQETEKVQPAITTVVFFEAPSENQAIKTKTDQIMCNMVLRAVERAIEHGYDSIRFVDATPYKSESSPAAIKIEELEARRNDIKIELSTVNSIKSAIQQMKQPDDIVLGISSLETAAIIDYAALQGKAVAAYVPETGEFDRHNLPGNKIVSQKEISVSKGGDNEEIERV